MSSALTASLVGGRPNFPRVWSCDISTQVTQQSRAGKDISMTYFLVQSVPARTQRCVTTGDRAWNHAQLLSKFGRYIAHCSPSVPWCAGLKCRRSASASCTLGGTNLDHAVNNNELNGHRLFLKATYLSLFFAYFRWASQLHPGFPSFSIASTK